MTVSATICNSYEEGQPEALKEAGNSLFHAGEYMEAMNKYESALELVVDASSNMPMRVLLYMSTATAALHQDVSEALFFYAGAVVAFPVRAPTGTALYRFANLAKQIGNAQVGLWPMAVVCRNAPDASKAVSDLTKWYESAEPGVLKEIAAEEGRGEVSMQALEACTEARFVGALATATHFDLNARLDSLSSSVTSDTVVDIPQVMKECEAAMKNEDYDVGFAQCCQVLSTFRLVPILFNNLAATFLKMNDPVGAMGPALAALAMQPRNNSTAFVRAATAAFQAGWLQHASHCASSGLQYDPTNSELKRLIERCNAQSSQCGTSGHVHTAQCGQHVPGHVHTDSDLFLPGAVHSTERSVLGRLRPKRSDGQVTETYDEPLIVSKVNELPNGPIFPGVVDTEPLAALRQKLEQTSIDQPQKLRALEKYCGPIPENFDTAFLDHMPLPPGVDLEIARKTLFTGSSHAFGGWLSLSRNARNALSFVEEEMTAVDDGLDPKDPMQFASRQAKMMRLGMGSDPEHVRWYKRAPIGSVRFPELSASGHEKRSPSSSNVVVSGPADFMCVPPGDGKTPTFDNNRIFHMTFFSSVPQHALPIQRGDKHVAVGFVDLGVLAETLAAQHAQQQRGEGKSKCSDKLPLRWVGVEKSSFCCAKALVIVRMIQDGAAADCVVQVCVLDRRFCSYVCMYS